MKLSFLTLLFVATLLSCAAQPKILITASGDLQPDTDYTKRDTTNITLIPPLRGTATGPHSMRYDFDFGADFSIGTNKELVLKNPSNAVSTTEWLQAITATDGQSIFTFVNLPAKYYDYDIIKNRLTLEPIVDYLQVGNTITLISPAQKDARIVLRRRK